MESIWEKSLKMRNFESLNGDIEADVLVIGGGIAGLVCAYMLTESGVNCVVAEKGKICSGITKNTTAKITIQHGLIYDRLIKEFGTEKAGMYMTANKKALERYSEMCQNIDCDFEIKDSFVYSLRSRKKLCNELEAIKILGGEAEYLETLPLPFTTVGAIRIRNQAQFAPLKFLSSISEKLKIYEDTEIYEIRGNTALSDKGSIKAEKIVVATHFPFMNKYGGYFLKLYQSRSYVLALKGAENVHGMYIDEANGGLSFRNYGDILLLGGNGHRTGKKSSGWEKLSDFTEKYYPNATETARWATKDCMTLDGVPYIGKYSQKLGEIYVATGFNKWGMTSGMVSAMIISDMILGRENTYKEIFSPSRSSIRPQLALNIFEATANLLRPTTPRCPHMGCALLWNKQEKTWDCPCHGSRFTSKGKVIDNPATGDMKLK